MGEQQPRHVTFGVGSRVRGAHLLAVIDPVSPSIGLQVAVQEME